MDNSIFTDIVALYMAAGPRVDNPALVALLSVIPGWVLFVQVERYRQGVPLLEGPIWQRPGKSPRTIAREDTAPTKTTGSDGHSQVERGSAHFATPYPEPSYVPTILEHLDTVLSADSSISARTSRPLSAEPLEISGLVVYQQPLRVHDSSTVLVTWVCALFVGCIFVMLSFYITAKGRACLAGVALEKKVEEPRKAKTSNWTLSDFESVEIFPSAQDFLHPTFLPPLQTTQNLRNHRENRELQKVIELMEGSFERQQTQFAKLQQQNRGLRWGKDQKAKKLAAAETTARNLRLGSADHTNHEPAQAKNDPGDYPQEDRKSEEDCHGYAHLETPEEGKNGRQHKKVIDQKDDSDSDDSSESLDLSLFFKILGRKKRRRGNWKPKAVHAEDAAPPEDLVGGDLTNEPPSFPPFHDLPCKEAQGTAVNEGASTDSTAALTPCTTPNRTHADSAQGRRDESGEVREDAIRKDTTTSTVETHDDNGKKGGNEDGDEDVKEGGKREGREDGKGGREVKADRIASKKRGDCNDDSEKKSREAKEDRKEYAEKGSNGDIDENLSSGVDDGLENDGLDGASAVGEGKPKKKRIRQNKKKRIAKRAAAAAANKGIGEAPDAFRDDTKVEPGAHHPPETGPGRAPQANKKGKGSKERKQEKIFKAPYHHEESEGGEAYQRMAHHLRKSDGGIHTNNEALSNLLLRRHEALQTPYHGQFQGGSPETLIRRGFSGRLPWVASGFPYTRRSIAFPVPTPFETPIQSDFSGQVPWVASTLPHIWRSNTYPDQETMNQAQRPMFFGPGVEPTNLVGPSTYTPWTSMYPTSWRPAGSFAWQGPWNERAARAWNNTAAAGFIPRGRLPYPNPPFEHRQTDGFARNANHTPFRAPFFIGSHSSSRFATATYDGFTVPIQGPNLHVDDTNAGEIDGLDTIPAPILADGSDEQYQYFPERGARSRSSPRRSRSQLRSPVRNKRPQSSPPQRLSQSEAENLPQATLE